ncbi:MAG: O-antigen ligase family protein [Limisphaerales bacterium]
MAILVLVWAPFALASVRPLEFLAVQGLTTAALALWGVRIWTQRPFRLLWPPMCWGVLAFVLYALVRCRLVTVDYVGRQQLTHVLVYAVWFVIILNNLTRRESATIVSMTLISVGVVLSFFAMYQFATHSTKVWGETRPEQYWQRGGGTFFNPNNLAGYLEMLVPLALSYIVLGRLSATIKVVLAYAALAMLAGILVTVSRGGIIAAGVALILLCVVLVIQGKFWLPAIAIGCFLIAVALGVSNQFETLQKRFATATQNDKIGDSRMFYWRSARQLFARDMLWGIGPGHFDVEFPQVRPAEVQTRPQYVHNDYLNTLCEWGVAGAAIVTAALVLLYAGAFRALRAVRKDHNDLHSKSSDRAAFVLGASVGLAGLLFHCIVEFNMQIPADALTAVTLMALLTAQWRFVTERYWMNPGFGGKIALTVMAVMAAGYLAAAGIHRGTESFWVWRASTERASWERLLATLKKAHQADPTNPDTDIHLGETCWEMSLAGDRGYEDKAKEAVQWFGKAMELNPFDPVPPVCIGLCLDWIGQSQQATTYFELATKRDPNNAYIATEMGRHCVALHDYSAAKHWFNHSMELEWSYFAADELALLERRLADPLTAPGK